MVSVGIVVRNVVVVLLLSYVSISLYLFLVSIGIGVHFNNVHPGKCRVVPGISCGSEKISVTRDGLAFITSGYKEITRCNRGYLKGNLYAFDFNQPYKNVTKLMIRGEGFDSDAFVPHGMDIYEPLEEDLIHVYVVNHANEIESVEVFVYDRQNPFEIIHKKTIRDDKFTCLNDIALMSSEHFYVTNMQRYCKLSGLMGVIEFLFLARLKLGSVVLFDRGETRFVAHGPHLNGLTLSKDGNHLFVSHGANDVHVYALNPTSGNLSFARNVFIGHGVDNIIVDKQTGHFYVAYFKNFGFNDVAKNNSEYCGSSGGVIKVGSEDLNDIRVNELLHDDGKDFVCGASSFVHYKGQYLVGTIFDKLGHCVNE